MGAELGPQVIRRDVTMHDASSNIAARQQAAVLGWDVGPNGATRRGHRRLRLRIADSGSQPEVVRRRITREHPNRGAPTRRLQSDDRKRKPSTRSPGFTSRKTSDPMAMNAASPIVSSEDITARGPIHTRSPTETLPDNVAPEAISQPRPMRTL